MPLNHMDNTSLNTHLLLCLLLSVVYACHRQISVAVAAAAAAAVALAVQMSVAVVMACIYYRAGFFL